MLAATTALPNSASAQVSRLAATFAVWTASTRGSAVAYDPRNGVYLAVSANGLVRGRFISADGVPLGAATVIQSSANFTAFPRVAYSPDIDGGAGGFLVTTRSTCNSCIASNGGFRRNNPKFTSNA